MPTYRFELSGDPEPFVKDFASDADAWAEIMSVCRDILTDGDGETLGAFDIALRVFQGGRGSPCPIGELTRPTTTNGSSGLRDPPFNNRDRSVQPVSWADRSRRPHIGNELLGPFRDSSWMF